MKGLFGVVNDQIVHDFDNVFSEVGELGGHSGILIVQFATLEHLLQCVVLLNDLIIEWFKEAVSLL